MVITIRVPKGRDDLDDKVLSFSFSPPFCQNAYERNPKKELFFFFDENLFVFLLLFREKKERGQVTKSLMVK